MQQSKISIFIIKLNKSSPSQERRGLYYSWLVWLWGVPGSQGCREQENEKLRYHRTAGETVFLQSNKGAVNVGTLALRSSSQPEEHGMPRPRIPALHQYSTLRAHSASPLHCQRSLVKNTSYSQIGKRESHQKCEPTWELPKTLGKLNTLRETPKLINKRTKIKQSQQRKEMKALKKKSYYDIFIGAKEIIQP